MQSAKFELVISAQTAWMFGIVHDRATDAACARRRSEWKLT
jgi:hypothetical protein